MRQIHTAEQPEALDATALSHHRGSVRLAGIAALAGVLLACASGGAYARPRQAGATARAARSESYVKEEGHLHLAHKSGGSAIVEEGSASGTFNASVRAEITIKISEVTGYVVVNLKGGSISGYASATPHFSGKYVSFKGSLTIKRGTGRYRGASGTAGFYGALNHANYTLSVQLIGHLHM